MMNRVLVMTVTLFTVEMVVWSACDGDNACLDPGTNTDPCYYWSCADCDYYKFPPSCEWVLIDEYWTGEVEWRLGNGIFNGSFPLEDSTCDTGYRYYHKFDFYTCPYQNRRYFYRYLADPDDECTDINECGTDSKTIDEMQRTEDDCVLDHSVYTPQECLPDYPV